MYLKSIEIQGFKSFANKIKFEFHNGITGIVGPNGSGKSNVADAVRWVLGEQRVKQLRGSSMQDVIFAGTQARRPLGFAFVAITLDNTDRALPIDYSEVTVARRIYRSGESEYLLNGTVCRLRDVNELFYDTGIGKEGYSIIGQGQIDRILSDKPQDRRALFDEAAGIVKYKHRKEQTLKSLESERGNLARITDILGELEKQIPSLEKQQEKAREYLKRRDALKRLDVNAFLIENENNTRQLEELVSQEETAAKDLESARAENETLRARIEKMQEERRELESRIEKIRSRITDASIVRGRIEGDIKVLEEQIRGARQRCTRLTEQEKILRADIAERDTQERAISQEIRSAQERFEKLSREYEQARETAGASSEDVQALREKLEETRESILEEMDRRANIKSKLASLRTLQAQETARREELERELSAASDERAHSDDAISALKEEFRDVGEKIRSIQESQKEIESQIAAHKTSLGDADARLRSAEYSYHQEKSRLDALANLAERYEGFGVSVKRVMQEREREPGIIGTVADLLKTEKKYETAIEVALGGSIQNIVTKDEETARRLIEILKREKAGRATFLPLSGIRAGGASIDQKILGQDGVIGTADTLVRTAEGCRQVAESLLGRTLIVDTFDHAVAIARRSGRGVRMVTLEGELFAPGGAISGGTYKNASNLLGRRREMEELAASTEHFRQEVERQEKAIEDTKESRNVLRRKLDENKRTLQETFIRQNTLRIRIQQEEQKLQEASGNAENMRQELRALKERISSTEAACLSAESELTQSEKKEEELSVSVSSLQDGLAAREGDAEKDSALLSKLELEKSRLEQELRFQEQNAGRIRRELEGFRGDLMTVTQGLETDRSGIEERMDRIRSLTEEAQASEGSKSSDEDVLRSLRKEAEELED